MLTGTVHSKYNAEMFLSRKIISGHGFFDPLIEALHAVIPSGIDKTPGNTNFMLDAGCGEGSIISRLLKKSLQEINYPVQGVGIDISKEGIRLAARDYENCIWLVGDITDMPFMPNQYDVILNILSPSNYKEFKRILKDDGILIKVLPGENYLAEIREMLFADTEKAAYSNKDTLRLFNENVSSMTNQNISYTIRIDNGIIPHVVRMTPLTWKVKPEDIKKVNIKQLRNVSVEFTILVGKK